MEMQKNIADTLYRVKLKRNLSLTEFAKELGISRSSLQEYIAGRDDLRLSTIEFLAQGLEMDPIELISGEDSLPDSSSRPSSIQMLAEHLQQFRATSTEVNILVQELIRLAENCPIRRGLHR